MNSKEFVKKVFEIVWGTGASVEHYRNGLEDFAARANYFTYEDTLDLIIKWKDNYKEDSPHTTTVTNIKTERDIVDKILNTTNHENGWNNG